jgi:4-amino-4-deoxy-L-arabinose transferase-like glycosyltransferase
MGATMKRIFLQNKLLLTILVVAACIRLIELGNVPVGLYVDEAAIGVDALSVAQTGKDMHGNFFLQAIYPSYGDYKLPVYIVLASGAVKLFGASEFAVRLPSALAGITTVFLVYVISQKLLSFGSGFTEGTRKRIGLWASALTAILPWSILFSRTGFEGHVGQMFVLCSVYFACTAAKSWKSLLFSVFFGAIAVYTYYSIRFVFPVVFLSILSLQMTKKSWKDVLKRSAVGLVVWAALLIPMRLSPLYLESETFRLSARSILQDKDVYVERSNTLREHDSFSFESKLFHHRSLYMIKAFAKNVAAHFDSDFLFLTGDSNLRHGTGKSGLLFLSMMPALLVGMFSLFQKNKKLLSVLAIWFLAALVPASVPHEVPHALRSLNGLGVVAILLGIGMKEIVAWSAKSSWNRFIVVCLGVCITLQFVLFATDYLTDYRSRSAQAWFDGNKQAARELIRLDKELPIDQPIVVSGDEKMFLWYSFFKPVLATDLQKVASVKFRKESLGRISFGTDAVQSFLSSERKGCAVGLADELGNTIDTQILGEASGMVYGMRCITKESK